LERYYGGEHPVKNAALEKIKRDRQEILQTLIDSVENLKGNMAMREIKELLQIHKAQMKELY
jgi:hypothetical protein